MLAAARALQQQSVPVDRRWARSNPDRSRRPGKLVPPTGPAPRLPNGKPDFSGVWDHPYVPDMSLIGEEPALQKGAGPLPYTPAGLENIKSYDPEKNGDYTGMCMPFGLMRSLNAPFPFQIMQNDKSRRLPLRAEHLVPRRRRSRTSIPQNPNPTWFGESIAKWDGDTLVIDTIGFNGFTRLDTTRQPAQRQAARGADVHAHRCRAHRLQGDDRRSRLLQQAVDERAHVHAHQRRD